MPGRPERNEDWPELREQLATGEDPAAAALALAELLQSEERVEAALAAVDAGRARRPDDPRLRLLRIELLRDLGRRHVAYPELRELLGQSAARSLPPVLYLDLAQLAWLEGDTAGARAALATAQDRGKGEGWYAGQAEAIASLTAEVATLTRPARLPVRDLLGNLRGAPPAERKRAFEELVTLGDEARARAVAIAGGDADPLLRSLAVQRAEVDAPALDELCSLALADGSALVRSAAANRCRELPADRAVVLLQHALAAETDGDAFVAEHQALASLVPGAPALEVGVAATAEGRANLLAAWRQQWGR